MSSTSSPQRDARAVAAHALGAILRRGRTLDQALDAAPGMDALTSRDAAFARLLLLTTLRRLGQIDAFLAGLMDRPLPARRGAVQDVLRLGVAQLAFLETPAHAAVASTVALARGARLSPYRGLINAVLRRAAREHCAIAELDAPRLNTPGWLWRSWCFAYGEARCRAIAETHLNEPPLDLSLVPDTPERVTELCTALGAQRLPGGTLRLRGAGEVARLAGYDAGQWWVQDAAAALPARLLGPVAGKRVLEIGAAPGGKTAQLAAAGARVTAVDRSAPRLARLRENLGRFRLEAEIVEADALDWQPTEPFDTVLLDAPCTATGTIRRHPDIPHLRGPADVGRLAELQGRLLARAATMVASGGLLVYASCSLQPEECKQRVENFLESAPEFARLPVLADELPGLPEAVTDAGDLRTLPCHWAEHGGMDGFYAARLRHHS
ncbi:MAG: methyltransferase domain-containing protein [Rhodospirillales bacterium]|nr:methyltransferase domain-containing protein [Rhodospirillales bacterium]